MARTRAARTSRRRSQERANVPSAKLKPVNGCIVLTNRENDGEITGHDRAVGLSQRDDPVHGTRGVLCARDNFRVGANRVDEMGESGLRIGRHGAGMNAF